MIFDLVEGLFSLYKYQKSYLNVNFNFNFIGMSFKSVTLPANSIYAPTVLQFQLCRDSVQQKNYFNDFVDKPYKNESLTTIFTATINRTKSYTKIINVKHVNSNKLFIFVEIRQYRNKFKDIKPTKFGICITKLEYDWLMDHLTYHQYQDDYINGITSGRRLDVKPIGNGIELIQMDNDRYKKINLSKKEVEKLLDIFPKYKKAVEKHLLK